MSATGRSDVRRLDDHYVTPGWATRAILKVLPSRPVLDPFAGTGAILIEAVRVWGTKVSGIELDPKRAGRGSVLGIRCGDAFQETWDASATVITNPPYSLAMEAVRAGFTHAPDVDRAYLLRLGFLESMERAPFHRANPCDLYVLPRRPSFAASYRCHVKDGGCGWCVLLELDAPRPGACPQCGKTRWRKTTSDSAAYGWLVWGPGRGGHFEVLDVEGGADE